MFSARHLRNLDFKYSVTPALAEISHQLLEGSPACLSVAHASGNIVCGDLLSIPSVMAAFSAVCPEKPLDFGHYYGSGMIS